VGVDRDGATFVRKKQTHTTFISSTDIPCVPKCDALIQIVIDTTALIRINYSTSLEYILQ